MYRLEKSSVEYVNHIKRHREDNFTCRIMPVYRGRAKDLLWSQSVIEFHRKYEDRLGRFGGGILTGREEAVSKILNLRDCWAQWCGPVVMASEEAKTGGADNLRNQY